MINGILELKDSTLTRSNYTKRLLRHVTEPLPSCLASVENRVRLAMERLLPHDVVVIEEITVTKRTHSTRKTFVYLVGDCPKELGFEAAVAAVSALADRSGREAEG